MAGWLRGRGTPGEFHFADHSGLSPESRISPLTLARVLAAPAAVAALDGIMKPDPLREALGAESRGAGVRAKTGTLNFVSNIAGYAADGITFAILTADEGRLAATAGADLPDGVLSWTVRSKRLQRDLIERFERLATEPQRHVTTDYDFDSRG